MIKLATRKRSALRNKKALSPVIATVILVAVTITVAISVAYWMGGIAGLYTRFEKVEVASAYATKVTGGAANGWTITMNVKNTGSADASIDALLINGKPSTDFSGANGTVTVATLPTTAAAGGTGTITVNIRNLAQGCSSGTTIEVKLHTAAGKDYPQMVTLP